MAKFKVDPPFLKKKEEKLGKDLDKDGEKGESPAHRAKVLGGSGKGKGAGLKACKKCKPGTMHPLTHPHFTGK